MALSTEESKELSLFSGAGGGLLGSKLLGWRTICYVENNPYCVEVLKARIRDGYLDDAPIWDDVRTFDGYPWAGSVDIVTAGFPCQPWSNAGKQLGAADKRNLWPDTIRIVRQVRPRYVFLENVPGLISNGYIGTVLGGLAEAGYDAEWGVLSAKAVGAPHLRKRVWIMAMAYTQGIGEGRLPVRPRRSLEGEPITLGSRKEVPDASINQLEKSGDITGKSRFAEIHWWSVEPELGRVADGIPHRVDRLRAIGNGEVPAVARTAWMILSGRMND